MAVLRTLEILLPRELKQAGMLDEEVCAWGYGEAMRQQCEQISVTCPGGWQRTYSLREIRAMLQKTPHLQPEVNMGINRMKHLRKLGSA